MALYIVINDKGLLDLRRLVLSGSLQLSWSNEELTMSAPFCSDNVGEAISQVFVGCNKQIQMYRLSLLQNTTQSITLLVSLLFWSYHWGAYERSILTLRTVLLLHIQVFVCTWVCSSKKSASFFSGAGVCVLPDASIHSYKKCKHRNVAYELVSEIHKCSENKQGRSGFKPKITACV